jgi:ATP-dependent Zn protease
MSSKQLIATAYHEAGHAVIYHLLHIPFSYVTIIPNEEEGYAGIVERSPRMMLELNTYQYRNSDLRVKERYAKGEITSEEFRTMSEDLKK